MRSLCSGILTLSLIHLNVAHIVTIGGSCQTMKKQEYQILDTRKRELEFHACSLVLYMYCLANESGIEI